MHALARLLVMKSVAWATVLVVVALAAVSAFYASGVVQDDDLLAFLPRDNPDVQAFYDVNERFGGLDVALVGISSEDPFESDFLTRLKGLTKKLNQTEGVDYALSLGNVEDFAVDLQKGGIGIDYLLRNVPETPEEREALREKVMSRDQVVGNLISADGKAILIYCFGAYGANPRTTAASVREAVLEAFPSEPKYWGGAPFISSYIYDVTQKDLERLTPWACLVIILITIASFRDAIGSALALISTAIGISWSVGLMAALGVHSNIVLGSMPIILFALGSAYAIHILTRYYVLAGESDCETALTKTLVDIGPTVVATGLTTVAGILSFICMDMQPMRTFGLFTAIGVLSALILAITFVPAVIRITNLKGKKGGESPTSRLMVGYSAAVQKRRVPVGIALLALTVAGAVGAMNVDSRMDNAAFFAKGSPPDQAEGFLRDHFGGSQFFQLEVAADMDDPAVLRQVRLLADRLALLPNVSSVTHVGSIVAKINEAMEGDERVPDTAAKVKLLYGFLAGKRAVTQLVTDDRKRALLHVKVSADRAADLEQVFESVERLVAEEEVPHYQITEVTGPREEEAHKKALTQAIARIRAASVQFAVALSAEAEAALADRLKDPRAEIDEPSANASVLRFLRSEEFVEELPEDATDAETRLASALVAVGPRASKESVETAVASALGRPVEDEIVGDIAAATARPVDEILRRQAAKALASGLATDLSLTLPEGPKAARYLASIANAVLDLDVPTVLLPAPAAGAEAAAAMDIRVTGLPILHRGLSHSVASNQLRSFLLAMGLVLIILTVLYRSLWSSLLALSPVCLTLLVIYGAMGFLGVRLDIGTSMLASLIIGAGVDYAVHLIATWNAPASGSLADAATEAASHTGPAIWINALMVSAGFVVLTLGEARPLQNVGGLTAAAMVAAALATFTTIPVLARKLRYGRGARIGDAKGPSHATGVGPRAVPPLEAK